MRKLADDIGMVLGELSGDESQVRKNARVRQVHDRYREVITAIYRARAQLFLDHTNSVYIADMKGVRTLAVYVDESIFAAELNAQRELIKLKLLELFGEDVEKFQIRVSGYKYKSNHPFKKDPVIADERRFEPVPLDQAEIDHVSTTVSTVNDERLQKALKRAMTADLQWKKSENRKVSN